MALRIEDLPNLGPHLVRRLYEISVTDEDALRELGAVAVYRRLKFQFGREITLNALWALDGALSRTDWRDLSEARKGDIRLHLDQEGKP